MRYLAADRTGRGFALQESMRNRFFDAFAAYQNKLEALGQLDWGDVPRRLWGAMQAGEVAPPRYDAVLVDEAQFFAPIWFEIIKSLLDPATGHLFLVADPTQGFLGRGQSWVASGLEVRGRSHRLNKSYRTTRRILDFATWMYRTRIPDEQEDVVVPDLDEMPEGVVPMLIPLTSPQDEITRVVNEIVNLVAEGVPRQHILVIHADWQGVERLLARLNEALGPGSAVDPKEGNGGQAIRVCTLNATTGLESPIVFLVGLKTLYEQEQSLRVSDEERVELIRDNTRKVYMAITRAGQRIVITYAGELPEWLRSPK
jgi:superfamily I DNA/RNA helicase